MDRYSALDAERTTVKLLREQLAKLPDDAQVIAFDPESDKNENVTGLLYRVRDNTIDIQTDDIT